MKDNTFYRSEMDNGKWHVYLFKPSWDHNTYGKWGKTDNASHINSIHNRGIFKRAEEISGDEEFLDNLKWYAIKELFKNE